ncbi:MAG: lytic transglycosylase domain-containing protein [Candidatus Caenarcaniphilales bacterium]|nr:lytic transglycosylase domain-containing protein [Candidatus Caenarcaniphilales bacterium]
MVYSKFGALEKLIGRIREIDQRLGSIRDDLKAETTQSTGETSEVYEDITFADILKDTFRKLPPRANKWVVEDAIQKAAIATQLDPDLLKAVIKQESGGNSNAVSKSGAKGLMQLMDGTARELKVKDPFDPHANVMGGAIYLKTQLTRFGGDLGLALAAYNAGPQSVIKHKGIPPYSETQKYVKAILSNYDKQKIGQANLDIKANLQEEKVQVASNKLRPREIHQKD